MKEHDFLKKEIIRLALTIVFQQFMLALVGASDAVTLWGITIPIGCLCAFILKLPVLTVYFVLNLDEIVKLPVVYRHYKNING